MVEQEEIPAAGHQYQTFVIAPTCTEQGFTVDTCDICDVRNYYDYLEATGHTEVVDRDAEDAVVREIFTVGNFTYCVNGYNTVRLTAVNYNESGTLYLPETITYNGRTYTVVEIGRMFNGLVEQGNVIPSEFTAVHLPKTLRFIWDGAIFGHSVEKYTVDPKNPCFTAKDGVLYTTNYYTLVQYPCNAPCMDRYVIPDETVYIAKGSLRNIRNPFGELVIGKNVQQSGVANWGYGYYDGTIEINSMERDFRCSGCFENTVQPIFLTGTCPWLEELAATATDGNVKVVYEP